MALPSHVRNHAFDLNILSEYLKTGLCVLQWHALQRMSHVYFLLFFLLQMLLAASALGLVSNHKLNNLCMPWEKKNAVSTVDDSNDDDDVDLDDDGDNSTTTEIEISDMKSSTEQ